MQQNPLVSVVMATYNGSKYIRYAIESVLGQTYKNIEFVIINDASTDNVENIIMEYQKKDDRIVYIKNQQNLKLTKSLNKGIDNSNGRYIARIDDDDIWCDDKKLEKQVKFMEENPDCGLCGTGIILIDENGKEIDKVLNRGFDDDIRKHILQSNQFAHSSILMRKSIIDKVGKYCPEWNLTEDYDLWLRIGRISKLANIQKYYLKYRYVENSVMRKKAFKRRLMAYKLCTLNRKYYPNFLKSFFLRIPHLILTDKMFTKLMNIKNRIFK